VPSKVFKKMFKRLIQITISLIVKPSEAWKGLAAKQDEEHEKFLSDYVYPFVGMVAVAAFVGVFFSRKEFDFQIALKSAIIGSMAAFGGFFAGAYLLNESLNRFFERERDMKLSQRFVGYASALMFSLNIVLSLLPEFFFLSFLVLYTVYIVWEGVIPYLEIKPEDQMKFTAIASAIIVVSPVIIKYLLVLLMPGLRI